MFRRDDKSQQGQAKPTPAKDSEAEFRHLTINDWYDAVEKIAEEAKQTGISSQRRAGIRQADLVNMSPEQYNLISFLWANIILDGLPLIEAKDEVQRAKSYKNFWKQYCIQPVVDTVRLTKQVENFQPLTRALIMLLVVLRKSGIILDDLYAKVGVPADKYRNINDALDQIAVANGDCVDQLGIALSKYLHKAKIDPDQPKMRAIFEDQANKESILYDINTLYFEMLSQCAGAHIPTVIRKYYLSETQKTPVIIASPHHIGSGGCSRAAIAMGIIYMANRALQDRNFAEKRFDNPVMQALANILMKTASSKTTSPTLFSPGSATSLEAIYRAFIDCGKTDKERLEKIEAALTTLTAAHDLYKPMVNSYAELMLAGYIPEDMRASLLQYCMENTSNSSANKFMNLLLALEEISGPDPEIHIVRLMKRLAISSNDIENVLEKYFTTPATPWLSDETTQEIIHFLGGTGSWLVPGEVKITDSADIAKYNLTSQHSQAIFPENPISMQVAEAFEPKHVLSDDFARDAKTPSDQQILGTKK